MLLDHVDRYDLGHALRLSLLACIAEGVSTADIGGRLGTADFTAEVVSRLRARLATE